MTNLSPSPGQEYHVRVEASIVDHLRVFSPNLEKFKAVYVFLM